MAASRLVGQAAQRASPAARHRSHEASVIRRVVDDAHRDRPAKAPPLAFEEDRRRSTPTVLRRLSRPATNAAHNDDFPTPGGR